MLLLNEDPAAKELPQSGVWISGVRSIKDTSVYLRSIQFALNNRKLDSFLLILFVVKQRAPSFFDCTVEKVLLTYIDILSTLIAASHLLTMKLDLKTKFLLTQMQLHFTQS